MTAQLQGAHPDFALHTIGWQAFQDLAASIAEVEYSRPVMRTTKTSDEGRDGFFYGLPEKPLGAGDQRETTIQCKHFSRQARKLTPTSLQKELKSVRKLVKSGRAHGYILVTNAKVTEGDRKKVSAALKDCGVERPYVFGGEWVVAKILDHPKVRALYRGFTVSVKSRGLSTKGHANRPCRSWMRWVTIYGATFLRRLIGILCTR